MIFCVDFNVSFVEMCQLDEYWDYSVRVGTVVIDSVGTVYYTEANNMAPFKTKEAGLRLRYHL